MTILQRQARSIRILIGVEEDVDTIVFVVTAILLSFSSFLASVKMCSLSSTTIRLKSQYVGSRTGPDIERPLRPTHGTHNDLGFSCKIERPPLCPT